MDLAINFKMLMFYTYPISLETEKKERETSEKAVNHIAKNII